MAPAVRKVYIHYEQEPAFTRRIIVEASKHAVVQDLVQEFVSAFNVRHAAAAGASAAPLTLDALQVLDDRGRQLQLTTPIERALTDQADVFVRRASPVPQPTTWLSQAASSSRGAAASPVRAAQSPPAGSTEGAGPQALSEADGNDLDWCMAAHNLNRYVEQAQAAAAQGNFRAAGDVYEKLLELAPEHRGLLQHAATLWLRLARLPARALPHLRALVKLTPHAAEPHEMLGDCLLQLDQPLEAVKAYDAALRVVQDGGAATSASQALDLQVAMARALFACKDQPGLQDVAASLVMHVLGEQEAHPGALGVYAVIAEAQGLWADATRVTLRLLVAKTKDASVRALIARLLQREEGLQTLYRELSASEEEVLAQGPTTGTAAALAFIATVTKDSGAVQTTIQLLERAVSLDPGHLGYRLSLTHVWELTQQLHRVVSVAADALEHSIAQSGMPLLAGGVGVREWVEALRALPPLLPPVTSLAWLEAEPWTPGEPAPVPTTQPMPDKVEYDTQQLDALAVAFTAAKTLFVGGALPAAARLVKLVLPAREACKQAIHTTLIRNEAAYFGCVAQLMFEHPPPPHQPSQSTQPQPLYLLGDSHCLSGAWRHVVLRGEPRKLHPVLVTGCKIWHLRPDSQFYPKAQFGASVAGLPDGAQVVMLLGEIDCREGLLLAVQKCKYDTLEDGVRATVDIYVRLLLELIKGRGFELFVHPVPPVLNETRAIVRLFNAVLREQVQTVAAAAEPPNSRRLHFLDFEAELLTPDGRALAPGLQLDGTHLAPTYLTHMQRQLLAQGM